MNWRTARLEDVAQVLGGGTPSRKEATYFGGGIAWATPTDVTALDGLYISATKESVTEAGLKSSSTKLMPPGAVLLTSRATIGYTAVATAPICTNQGFVNFVCGDALLPEFLAYWLRTQKDKMLQYAGGTTFKEIARGTLRRFEISFPSLTEQGRIVDLLSRAEGILRLRREAQAKAQAIIPALFLDMFGDPATNPKGWPVQPLGQLLSNIDSGHSPKCHSRTREGDEWGVLRLGAVTQCEYEESEHKTLPDGVQPDPTVEVTEGDLLFSRKNTPELVGASAYVWATGGRILLPDLIFRLRIADPTKVHPIYLWKLLTSKPKRQALSCLATGSAGSMPNISKERLRTLPIELPPHELQARFSEHVWQLQSISVQQGESLRKAETTFQALLARAFSDHPGER